ncbi:MAG: diguanylate cyclase [Gammaproteobacteria bacterium]|nr:diguanylate cyclase [Gammaproteobacteria bacterium]
MEYTQEPEILRNSFSPEEIDEALEHLQTAIDNHQSWFQSLHEGLLCQQPFQETVTDTSAHTMCDFGTWYYHNASHAIRANAEFQIIETTHKAMHDEARALVETFQRTGEIDLEDYRALLDEQRYLMQLLSSLRDTIVNQQYSFDSLTGLINRSSIGLILEKNHSHSLRHATTYTIAMMDIDYFKSINDNYGHLGGDTALKAVSKYLASSLRDSDSVSRYGGEEFLLLLNGATADIAFKILDRIRTDIEQLPIEFEGETFNLTLSIGFSSFAMGKTVWDIVKEADLALYSAKENGRNQVMPHDLSLL